MVGATPVGHDRPTGQGTVPPGRMATTQERLCHPRAVATVTNRSVNLSAGARLESHGNGINLRATRERPAGEGRTRARTDLDDDVIVIP